jgi:hypothetical protein
LQNRPQHFLLRQWEGAVAVCVNLAASTRLWMRAPRELGHLHQALLHTRTKRRWHASEKRKTLLVDVWCTLGLRRCCQYVHICQHAPHAWRNILPQI